MPSCSHDLTASGLTFGIGTPHAECDIERSKKYTRWGSPNPAVFTAALQPHTCAYALRRVPSGCRATQAVKSRLLLPLLPSLLLAGAWRPDFRRRPMPTLAASSSAARAPTAMSSCSFAHVAMLVCTVTALFNCGCKAVFNLVHGYRGIQEPCWFAQQLPSLAAAVQFPILSTDKGKSRRAIVSTAKSSRYHRR